MIPCSKISTAFLFGSAVSFATITAIRRLAKNPGTISKIPVAAIQDLQRIRRLHLAFAYKNRIGIKYMSFTEEDVLGSKRETAGFYNPTSAQIK